MLYGTSDAEPQTDYVVAQLSQELYNSNLLLLLIQVRNTLANNRPTNINHEFLFFSIESKSNRFRRKERRCTGVQ